MKKALEEKAKQVSLQPKKPPSLPPNEKDVPENEQEKEEEEEDSGAPVPLSRKRRRPRKAKSELLIDQDLLTMEQNVQRFVV